MISPADLATISAEDYLLPADIAVDGLHVRFTRVLDELIVSLRGSADVADWWQNFDYANCASHEHPQLDKIAAAFALPLLSKYDQIRAKISEHPLGGSPTLIGHSRGGAQAQDLAAFLKLDGITPKRLVTFGSPRAGSAAMAAVLADTPGADYQNGNDPVVYVPWFVRPRKLTFIGKRNGIAVNIADHFIAAYQASLLVLPS